MHGEPPDPVLHVHVASWDSATSPDYHGRIVVTEWCECGERMGSHMDSIL